MPTHTEQRGGVWGGEHPAPENPGWMTWRRDEDERGGWGGHTRRKTESGFGISPVTGVRGVVALTKTAEGA